MKLPQHLFSLSILLLSTTLPGMAGAATQLPSKVKNTNPRVIEKKQTAEIRIEHYPAREISEDPETAPRKAPPTHGFDSVPPSQIDSLVHRLEVTTALLRKHGRAYDYRIHPTRELEAVLADLDRKKIPLPPPPALSEDSETSEETSSDLLILPPPPTGN